MRYGNLSGVLSRDRALQQQWPGSGSRDCKGLIKHNFLNTSPNGASEVSIDMYVKRRCR
jgi:hypothetical protein